MLTPRNIQRFAESFTAMELPELYRDRVDRLVEVLRLIVCGYGAKETRNRPCIEVSETSDAMRIRVTAIPSRGDRDPKVLEESSWINREDPHLEQALLAMIRRVGEVLVPQDDIRERLETPVSWICDNPPESADGVAAPENGAGPGAVPDQGGLRAPSGVV